MRQDVCKSYLKKVKKRLRCTRKEKARLLAGLEAELLEACPEQVSLSGAELLARFGTPAEMAAQLQDALPAEETERYRKKRRLFSGSLIAGCALIIFCLTLYLVYLGSIDVKYIDSEIIINSHYRIN